MVWFLFLTQRPVPTHCETARVYTYNYEIRKLLTQSILDSAEAFKNRGYCFGDSYEDFNWFFSTFTWSRPKVSFSIWLEIDERNYSLFKFCTSFIYNVWWSVQFCQHAKFFQMPCHIFYHVACWSAWLALYKELPIWN